MSDQNRHVTRDLGVAGPHKNARQEIPVNYPTLE